MVRTGEVILRVARDFACRIAGVVRTNDHVTGALDSQHLTFGHGHLGEAIAKGNGGKELLLDDEASEDNRDDDEEEGAGFHGSILP